MSFELMAILMFASMLVLLLTGRHIFAVIGGVAVGFALLLWGAGNEGMAFHASFSLLNWYPLLTLPLFIYIGYMFSKSGIADDLYQMLYVWMGPVRGGLAIGTIVLMSVIAAINGLSVAGMAVGNTICLPEMVKRKYDKIMISGVIQGASSLGIMIPPSVVLTLYGMIARQPVGQLWMAGVLPGMMLALLFCIYIAIRCLIQPQLGPAASREERNIPWLQKFILLRSAILPIVIIFIMSGLFFLGVTSLVESAAVGAIAITIIAWINKRLSWKIMYEVMKDTLSVSCMFMWVILAALAFGAVFDGLGAVYAVEKLFLSYNLGRWGIMAMMQLSYIIMGCFLDDTAMLIVVAPLYVPLVIKLGFNPVWYGVLYTITCQIAYLTPPFGYNLFLMKAMAPKDFTIQDIYRSVWPFVGVMIVGLILVMIFPDIALYLAVGRMQRRAAWEAARLFYIPCKLQVNVAKCMVCISSEICSVNWWSASTPSLPSPSWGRAVAVNPRWPEPYWPIAATGFTSTWKDRPTWPSSANRSSFWSQTPASWFAWTRSSALRSCSGSCGRSSTRTPARDGSSSSAPPRRSCSVRALRRWPAVSPFWI
jgi:tripartite ATP-independent transporter DctM subunit